MKSRTQKKCEYRPTWRRMQVIWAALRSGRLVNASELAEQLEVSFKTIHRDLEFMRDQLGFDFEYDGSQFGYRIRRKPDCCPWCCPPEEILSLYHFPRHHVEK